MWQKLDIFASSRGKKSGLNVTGPPGTGKSMVAWAWTCYNSSRNKKNIVWIHVNKGNQKIDLCHFKDGYMHTYEEGSHELAATIKDIDADLMVVDGATNNEYGMFSSAATSWMLKGAGKRKVAFIMSASVVISSHHLFKAGIEEWHMPSWTWENYVAACDNTAFYDQIKGFLPKKKGKKKGYEKTDLLKSKFFLAGASARWMFSFLYSKLEDEIQKHLRRVTNKEWILSGVSDNNCAGAVGHLRFEDKNHNVSFVSRYVMIEVAKTCELKFIKDAYVFSRTQHNPAFKGWIVEFDFLAQLHQALKHGSKVAVSLEDKEKKLPVTEIKYIDPDHLQKLEKHAGLWLIPIRWNQGGYDAIYIQDKNTTIFVQITNSKQHDLKLQYMQNLWNKLHRPKRSGVQTRSRVTRGRADIWFVVPFGVTCRVKKTTGNLTDWDKTVKTCRFRPSASVSPHVTKGEVDNHSDSDSDSDTEDSGSRIVTFKELMQSIQSLKESNQSFQESINKKIQAILNVIKTKA